MNRLLGVVVGILAAVLWVSPASAATTASVAPSGGAPGTTVTVSGTGFDPNASVDVFFDTTNVAIAVSDASGAVSFSLAIPMAAQPGQHWITLDELRSHAAAQAPFNVLASWLQGGWGPSWRSFNPFENTINPGNVSQLTPAWSQVVSPYGNPKPFVDYNGYLYVYDESGVVHAYTSTGRLLWTATGSPFRFSQAIPAAGSGNVYIGDANGLVTAYYWGCRTDGGVCTTPKWSVNIGSAVNGGLSARNGFIYAPGADGVVHVLNAATGAAGTSITPLWTGPVTEPVSFAEDGTAYIVQPNSISAVGPTGGGISFGSTISFSWVAVGNGTGYVTGTDGNLREVPGGWSTAIGPTGCDIPPAFANNVVYAAGCNSVGAYDPNTGAVLWSVAEASQPQGLAVANGVLYACIGYRLYAYAASYGGLLASLGACDGHPEVVGGTLYGIDAKLFASTLNGATTTSAVRRITRRPNPRFLRASARLHRLCARQRHGRRHHPRVCRARRVAA